MSHLVIKTIMILRHLIIGLLFIGVALLELACASTSASAPIEQYTLTPVPSPTEKPFDDSQLSETVGIIKYDVDTGFVLQVDNARLYYIDDPLNVARDYYNQVGEGYAFVLGYWLHKSGRLHVCGMYSNADHSGTVIDYCKNPRG